MTENKDRIAQLLGRVVEQCLDEGNTVALEGLGTFIPKAHGDTRFLADSSPRVFIAYAIEDLALVSRLNDELLEAGISPWLDRKKLLPGQNWSRAIEQAIETSDFFVACFSKVSAVKRGQFPYEVRLGLRCSERMPLDEAFMMPVRLEHCIVPNRISAHYQYVDLFPDWKAGTDQLIRSIGEEWRARRCRPQSG